jgi:hypothetical protein
MKIEPNVKMSRFAKLQPGDLFICFDYDAACLAMKGVDPKMDGDAIILLLGPQLPTEMGEGPRVIGERRSSIVALGNDFVLRLPCGPEGWTNQPPPSDATCVLLLDDKVHIRANFGSRPGEVRMCWVEASTGVLRYDLPRGDAAYAVDWEIVIESPLMLEHLVFRASSKVKVSS